MPPPRFALLDVLCLFGELSSRSADTARVAEVITCGFTPHPGGHGEDKVSWVDCRFILLLRRLSSTLSGFVVVMRCTDTWLSRHPKDHVLSWLFWSFK